MSRVYTIGKGKLGITMPPMKQGTQGKRVQGGAPPVPFRQHSGNYGRASAFARVPAQGVWAD